MTLSDRQRNQLYYTFWIILIFGFSIGGLLLLISSVRSYPYSGTISNVECSICKGLTCFQTIYIDVNYIVNNTNQTGMYETVSFPNCEPEPLYYWEEQCCSNLIGTKVYFELSNKNSNIITKISSTNEDRETVHYVFSIILFCLALASFLACACIMPFWQERCLFERRKYVNISD